MNNDRYVALRSRRQSIKRVTTVENIDISERQSYISRTTTNLHRLSMSSPKSNETLPNPDTPLAFLPPEAAYQTSVAVYILVASLGVAIQIIH